MPMARHAILQAHAVAKEMGSLEDIVLCHAIGQACGVIHTKGHAMGFPIYVKQRWGENANGIATYCRIIYR